MGVEIHFNGQRHFITADRLQILNLLLSTYEAAIQRNQELTRAKNELRTANASLELSNKELEAFSYSVSHDLRAPLRAINGFTSIVLDESAQQLDENGKELLVRVQGACQRMGQLIDDLLSLSKVARCELNRNRVDLAALARTILGDLQTSDPRRQVSVRIGDGLTANGDATLLRVLLENLLGNAWKFTSRRPDATVEVGTERQDEETAFFVRDNGAGFDMTHMDKIFEAFQRLHSAEEFPGTGIGLATAQRIVQRHGGRIWARSKPGDGATFYFTL
jgi:light-regulated signal transduction histidine kinase (bacteriophytochrome)